MRIVNRELLIRFSRKHAQARPNVAGWIAEVEEASWARPDQIREAFPTASVIAGSRLVFRFGRQWRLVAVVNYEVGVVQVRFIGSHSEYDVIDAETI